MGGIGLRNADGNPVEFSLADPAFQTTNMPEFTMTVRQAFLYFNTIQKENVGEEDNSLYFQEEGGAEVFISQPGGGGDIDWVKLGCCGNTCWNNSLDPDYALENINFVYRADVTSALSTAERSFMEFNNVTYTVHSYPVSDTVAGTFDGTKFPGTHASQGVVLLVIFDWVDGPSAQGYPSEKDFWKVRVFDGCKLIRSDQTPGQIVHPTSCLGCPTFAFAAGDSQTIWGDSVYINGRSLREFPKNQAQSTPEPPLASTPTQQQVFWPNLGPGMGIYQQISPLEDTNITVDIIPESDCLCWFLYVHAAHCCNCHAKVQMVADGAGLNVSGTKTVSLGAQNVGATVTSDTCDCLDDDDPVLISVNGGAFQTIPQLGVPVNLGDLIDIRLNSTKCDLCEAYAPSCVGSSSSGGPRRFPRYNSSGQLVADGGVTTPGGVPCLYAAPDCCGNTCLPPVVSVFITGTSGSCSCVASVPNFEMSFFAGDPNSPNNDTKYNYFYKSVDLEAPICNGIDRVVFLMQCQEATWVMRMRLYKDDVLCTQGAQVFDIEDCSNIDATFTIIPSTTGNCAIGEGCGGSVSFEVLGNVIG